jgi:hypothetical protein
MKGLRDAGLTYYSNPGIVSELMKYFMSVEVMIGGMVESLSSNKVDTMAKIKTRLVKRIRKALLALIKNLNYILMSNPKPEFIFRIRKYLSVIIDDYTEFLYYNSLNPLYERINIQYIKSKT